LLAGIKRTSVNVLTNSLGRPWSASAFRAAFIKTCRKAGISGLHFHDLRGTFIARQYGAGESISDIAAISGHSERNAEQVIRKNYMPRTANVVRMERRMNKR
jgi:integrase